MEISPEERAKRKMELRPSVKSEKEVEPEAKIAAIRPKMQQERELTPDQLAKKALGLQPHDPMPQPENLTPQMRAALSKLDPKFQGQVMGVMGCLQKFHEKTDALSDKIQKNMGGAIERTRNTSLAQRAIIRRAHRGTLGQRDVELARGIIAEQGQRGNIDPAQEGLTELTAQREELVGASGDMQRLLKEEMSLGGQDDEHTQALAFVEQTLSQQAGLVSRTVDQTWNNYRQSDIERIQVIMEGQNIARVDQAAVHRPQGL